MSTATKANHGLTEHSHGFGAPVQIRSARFKSKIAANFPTFSQSEEQWRYVPITKLERFINEPVSKFDCDVNSSSTSGIVCQWVDANESTIGVVGEPEDVISAKAWEGASRVFNISVANTGEKETAQINFSLSDDQLRGLHVLVNAAADSESIVVLDHAGEGFLSENVEISLGENAGLTLVSLQRWNSSAVHLSSQFASLGRNSRLKHIVVSLGGSAVRVSSQATFRGEGAEVEMLGAYFASSKQFFENRLFVDHNVANCKSRVVYKGALQGTKAHTVWVGDVLIQKSAEGTDTYELNRNLLLTDGARADSVPNLEIETGQIAGAGHASASGRFDDEQLFYLQARGIPELEARQLVVRGFLNEVIAQIGIDEVQTTLTELIEAKLGEAS